MLPPLGMLEQGVCSMPIVSQKLYIGILFHNIFVILYANISIYRVLCMVS